MSSLLIISSQIHKDLSKKQLAHCEALVKKSSHDYQIEVASTGIYEIPFIINAYHQKNCFDGYIALGLVLKTDPDHYQYLTSHIQDCFTAFALNNIAVGNGIVSGASLAELTSKIESKDPCTSGYHAAFNAVDYLVKLKENLSL
ncbi:MAG: 6,7-dimethyl-8-ribityllumazine synthase [Tatlockia sp.]|nr:6,7-dimethyl-8-ribityllumazine synthase [Tatlockia sp.]